VHPQAFFTFHRFGVQEFVRQLLSIVAVIEAFEVDNETILLWTHRGNCECALSRRIDNGESGADGMARRDIRSERNKKVSSDAMRLSDSADL
jgi:hypothetical protein